MSYAAASQVGLPGILKGYLAIFAAGLLVSGIHPHDQFTWFLEVLPALVALVILGVTYRKFQFSAFTYGVILVHALILMLGGHYTYAEVPAFNWLQDHFGLARNYYDRVGHFMQGFGPALIAREVFVQQRIVEKSGWRSFIVVFMILGFSAFYEFAEWWIAVAYGDRATDFLGTQGDIWDTQWDMFSCFVGSLVALGGFSAIQDRALAKK